MSYLKIYNNNSLTKRQPVNNNVENYVDSNVIYYVDASCKNRTFSRCVMFGKRSGRIACTC